MQRARILLAIAAGQRKRAVAAQLECDEATVWRACERYRRDGLESLFADGREGIRAVRSRLPLCNEHKSLNSPVWNRLPRGCTSRTGPARTWPVKPWMTRSLPAISPATVRRILHDVDLQPHRTRYWKTARLDARFKERAEQVLWCYGNAERLAEQGIWVVCVDEIPTFQVLERDPIRRAIPGVD